MDRLFQLRRDELRYAILTSIEKRLGIAIKYAFFIALLITGLTRPGVLRQPIFYVYLGVFVSGTLLYSFVYKRFSSKHRVAVMTLSCCLEVFCISFVYCVLAGDRLIPIVFIFLFLPVLRVGLLYPAVWEFLMIAGCACGVFLFVTATLARGQLLLPWFWVYFVSMWMLVGLAAKMVSKLLSQFEHSIRNRQLILQALQMVSSLVEMAQSTAHLHEKSRIYQRSVQIISRVMAVDSCVAWIYHSGILYPAASEGLRGEQSSRFAGMELPIREITIFDRALTQKVPIVATDGELDEIVPPFYRSCFDVGAMLVIPLTDDKHTLGCIALHWRTAPDKITSQELAILSGIATQVGITLENVYLLEELREKEEIRGRLLERVISIQEEERERIARELHDETGQILTALMVNVEILKGETGFQSANFRERLEEISSLLSRTMEDIHNLSLELHPKMLNELGLVPAIRWYAKNHLERWGIDFNMVASKLNHSLSAKEEICLFRVAQEAITNVIRHAKAHRVDIEIGVDAESVYLGIKDDGIGFDEDPRGGEPCLGLRSMEERVSFLGGQLDIRSELGKGTEVSVSIPLRTVSDE